MTFSRSGGVAAVPGLRVHATVSFDASGGTVSAGDYSRSMSAGEAAALAASARHAMADMRARPPSSAGARDAFVYRFSIAADDRNVMLTLVDDGLPRPEPEQRLLDWARAEAAAIAGQRP
jgi:hypothetical protein